MAAIHNTNAHGAGRCISTDVLTEAVYLRAVQIEKAMALGVGEPKELRPQVGAQDPQLPLTAYTQGWQAQA
jgi:hypothetical protein